MKIEITFYGQLTDVTGTDRISVESVENTDELLVLLMERYPGLGSKKFIVAADNKIITGAVSLSGTLKISLLPHFQEGN